MSSGNQLSAVENEIALRTGGVVRIPRLGVCHIISGDCWAGAEVQVATLLKTISKRSDVDLCAVVLNEGRLAQEIRTLGIPLKVIPEAGASFFDIARQIVAFLRPRSINIVHSHRYKENVLALSVALQCGIPHRVRTQHGMPEPFAGFKHIKHAVVQALDRLTARWATDRVVCVTKDMQRQLAPSLGKAKLVVVHNGVDAASVLSPLTVSEAKRQLGIPVDCPVIGAVGRLEPVKRLDIFVAAAGHVRRKIPNARFLIVGEGSENERLMQLSDSLRIGDAILFTGHRDDTYDVLRATDLLVLCSDHEGLPMVLLQAMCLGVPVLARPVGGIPEVLEDGIHGWMADSADPVEVARKCIEALSDSEKSRIVRAAAHRVVAEFSAASNGAAVVALYKSLARAL